MIRSRAIAACLLAALATQVLVSSASAGRSIGMKFHAQSQAWVSPQLGWLLGSADCASGSCTTTVGTSNGGTSWHTLGSIAAPLTNEDSTGLTEVRFADALHGWAFAPALWSTSDGGASWQQEVTPTGKPVIALAANAQV